MPNPKLETYKNKATGTVYDFTDADAQSKVTATVDMLKDTTGWTGKNRFNYKNAVNATNVVSAVDMTSGEISIKDVTAQWSSTYIGYIDIENGKTYKLVADKVAIYGRFGFSTSASLYPQSGSYPDDMITFSGTSPQTAVKILFDGDISITAKASGRIYLWFCSDENYQTSHQAYTIKIMIADAVAYSLSPTYEPYHESVEEMLFYKAGDEVKLNGLGFAGFVTNGSTELHVAFTLSKIIKATNVSLSGQLTVRGLNGYVLQSKQISELTVSVEKIAENVVMIILKNTDSSAFNVTNNTPLFFTFELQTAKLTFTA